MAVTRSTEQIVRDEIAKAIEDHAENITSSNADQIFEYKFLKSKVMWYVQCCTVCRRPNFVHQDPWDENCTLQPVNQTIKTEYIDQLENHKTIKQIANRMIPVEGEEDDEEQERPRNPRRSRGERPKGNEKIKFPRWKEKASWDEYETMICHYRRVSKRDEETHFIDLMNALNDSDKEHIATRMSQTFKNHGNPNTIMDEAIEWIACNYGSSKSDRVKKVTDTLLTIKRGEDEDMADFIVRFEALMEQMRSVNLDLSEHVEVAILHRTANLSKTEENNILPLVDITSTTPGAVLKLKDALRNIGYRKGSTKKKEEVVLFQYEGGNEYQESEEEVLYGGGFQNNRGRFQNNKRGFVNIQLGRETTVMKIYRLLNITTNIPTNQSNKTS